MKYFSFSLKKWQFPFFLSIFYFIQIFCCAKMPDNNSLPLYPILNAFSLLFAVFPEIIYMHLNKQNDSINRVIKHAVLTKHTNIGMIISEKTSRNKVHYYLYILLIVVSVFDIGLFYSFAMIQSYGFSGMKSYFNILVTSGACYYLFNAKLYKHHLLSILIITIGMIIYYWVNSRKLLNYINFFFYFRLELFFLFYVVYFICSSIKEVLEHYLMTIKLISPFKLLFYEGVSSFAFYFVYLAIIEWTVNLKLSLSNVFDVVCYYSQWKFLKQEFIRLFTNIDVLTAYAWGYIIFGFFMNYFRIQTNKQLSPSHRYVSEMLFSFYWFIYDIIVFYIPGPISIELLDIILVRGCFELISIICILIFNEYLIVRICGLDQNTYVEIEKRSIEESNQNDYYDLELKLSLDEENEYIK